MASVDLIGQRGETATVTDLGTLQHYVNVRGYSLVTGTYADAVALLSGYTNHPTVPSEAAQQKIVGWSDSMGGDQGNLGISVFGGLGTALGAEVASNTFSGYTSTEVAAIHGGLPVYVTMTNGSRQIPAARSGIVVTIQPTNTFTATQFVSYSGSLAGVPGAITHNGGNNTYSFTRTTAGDPVTVPLEALWVPDTDQHRDWVNVFWLGRNNATGNPGSDAATIVRDVLAMTQCIRHDRYLVLPVLNGTGAATANSALADRFGRNFFDLRGYLSRSGLLAAGIAATTPDTTAMSAGDVPPSLLTDGTHLTAVGRKLAVNQIARLMVTKGWFPTMTPLPIP